MHGMIPNDLQLGMSQSNLHPSGCFMLSPHKRRQKMKLELIVSYIAFLIALFVMGSSYTGFQYTFWGIVLLHLLAVVALWGQWWREQRRWRRGWQKIRDQSGLRGTRSVRTRVEPQVR